MSRRAGCLLVLALLAGCGDDGASAPATEIVAEGPARFWVHAEGELKAAEATPLSVPGPRWSRRQLVWLIPDGSPVKAGQVVARFEAPQSRLQLDKALIELQRVALVRAGKETELEVGLDRVGVELAQAESALGIARRYARADFEAIARNTILDAVQDEQFLTEKTGVLRWRQDHSTARGGAELDVLGVQRNTLQTNVDTKQADLSALELRAAHDGVFMLHKGWSNEPPKVGEQLWAGGDFATLPDTAALEVELHLPQQEAQGLAVGQKVELAPMGFPSQQTEGEITWVASAPRQVDRQNPAKYVSAKASVPADVAVQHGWVPGQAFSGRVLLLDAAQAITVPNVALSGDGGEARVQVMGDDGPEPRSVTLGARGPARSQVLDGLAVGEKVLLAGADADPNDADASEDSGADATPEDAP